MNAGLDVPEYLEHHFDIPFGNYLYVQCLPMDLPIRLVIYKNECQTSGCATMAPLKLIA